MHAIRPLEGVKKWNKKPSQKEMPRSLSNQIEEKIIPKEKGIPGAAFVKSEYLVASPKLCF